MGDVLVDSLSNLNLPHKKSVVSSITNIEVQEFLDTNGGDEYQTMKKLQGHLE